MIRKTWRSTLIRKAGEADESAYDWLHKIADAAVPKVRQLFLEAIERIKTAVKTQELQAAIESGNVDAVVRVLDLEQEMKTALGPEITKPLEDAMLEAGRETPAKTFPTGGGRLSMRFDMANPRVADFVRQYDFGLIRQVSQETRDAIRGVVLDAMQFGGHPREQARQIREMIGLTTRQSQAVINYRSALEEEERPADQIERMTAKYRQKMLRLRAENIARTETLRAANAGQDLAWRQAADGGLLNSSSLRIGWLVTPDDRLCEFCEAVPDLNPDGIKLGESFDTDFGPVQYPPLHPQCRCTRYILEL